jgi:hypothetical protein
MSRSPFAMYRGVQNSAATSQCKQSATAAPPAKRAYEWITAEAEDIIKRAYNRHKALADNDNRPPKPVSVAELEKLGEPFHYEPKGRLDRLALGTMRFLRRFTHRFFG